MGGIVLELQQGALSKDANIEFLLRKAYPQYRYIGGALYALNPANGRWIPVGISGGGRDKFFKFPIKVGMSSLNDLYAAQMAYLF